MKEPARPEGLFDRLRDRRDAGGVGRILKPSDESIRPFRNSTKASQPSKQQTAFWALAPWLS